MQHSNRQILISPLLNAHQTVSRRYIITSVLLELVEQIPHALSTIYSACSWCLPGRSKKKTVFFRFQFVDATYNSHQHLKRWNWRFFVATMTTTTTTTTTTDGHDRLLYPCCACACRVNIVRILNVVITPLAFVMCTMKGIMEVADAIMMYKGMVPKVQLQIAVLA